MPRDYLVNINLNDPIENVIRKSNTNFRRCYHSLKSLSDQSVRESDRKVSILIENTEENIRYDFNEQIDNLESSIIENTVSPIPISVIDGLEI